jgi:serine/threonine protein kinase
MTECCINVSSTKPSAILKGGEARSRRQPLESVDPAAVANKRLGGAPEVHAAASPLVSGLSFQGIEGLPSKNYADEFHQYSTLGTGNFASVQRAIHKKSQQTVVLKKLRKNCSKRQFDGFLKREKWCLENLNHGNIVHAAEDGVLHKLGLGKSCSFQNSGGATVLILENLNQGDLFDYVQANNFIEEQHALPIFHGLLQGAVHLHDNGIVHLDIKCENVFLNKDSQGKLTAKLGDFGLVKVQALGDDIEHVTDCYGTECTMSPEVLSHTSFDGKRADAWALGYILFIMLIGFPPLAKANTTCQWYIALRKGPEYFWGIVEKLIMELDRPLPSKNVKQLINMLLNPNLGKRWTPIEALMFLEKNYPHLKAPGIQYESTDINDAHIDADTTELIGADDQLYNTYSKALHDIGTADLESEVAQLSIS